MNPHHLTDMIDATDKLRDAYAQMGRHKASIVLARTRANGAELASMDAATNRSEELNESHRKFQPLTGSCVQDTV